MIGGARLVYLYVGSIEVGADLVLYRDHLGGEVVWQSRAFGAEVAAVRLGDGPLVLLADHRDAPSVLPIWAVDDLDGAEAALRDSGWREEIHRVDVPDGPCLILKDPSGNELGLLQPSRGRPMEKRPPE